MIFRLGNKAVIGNHTAVGRFRCRSRTPIVATELPSVHCLLDGVEVEHRAPRRPNPLHCGRRVVGRIGLSGHELLLKLDRLPDFPCDPGAAVGLFADDAKEVTCVAYTLGF